MTSQDLSQQGRIAFVTGASRGIGRAAALGLANAGAQVIAAGRAKAALEELDDEVFATTGNHATLIPFDITDTESLERLTGALFERFGRLDTVVHSAGVLGTLTPITQHSPKDFAKVVDVNLMATWNLMRAVEPLLRQSASGRAIFLTTAKWVTAGRAFWGPYGATKAAVESLVRAWADELEITPIRAALVSPGAIRTRMRASAFPGEDPMSIPPPEVLVPLFLELADPSREPPRDVVDFRDWTKARAEATAS
ncbi:MAG TPA: SDR family NAD(P)-dependent oxidoreductase [Asticcacaulis sp.]|nr:SDR family NAD(P)-dependent oxidoreductase [Asticcacaulis sp.]